MHKRIHFFLMLVSTFTMAGCSYTYEVQAVLVQGQVAFVPKSRGWFESTPRCVNAIIVSAGFSRSSPLGSDVIWENYRTPSECANRFPIKYGLPLSGEHMVQISDRSARPLIAGVVYIVETQSEGSGYGTGRFTMTPQGRVQNLDE